MSSLSPAAGSADPTAATSVRLEVRNLGHVPAKKNSMYAVVDPRNRRWQDQCIQSLKSQLLSKSATGEPVTLTQQQLRSLIASLPYDDDWRIVCHLSVRGEACAPGDEGASIVIESL